MKKFFFTILFFNLLLISAFSENISCKISLKRGTVNELKPNASMSKIQKTMPFFTGASPEKDTSNYGGGVFYKNCDIYFYTYLDLINIREDFSGAIDIPVFNMSYAEIQTEFGKENRKVKSDNFEELHEWKMLDHYIYAVLENDKCSEIYISKNPIEKADSSYNKLCAKKK